jgi:hypothetical protein
MTDHQALERQATISPAVRLVQCPDCLTYLRYDADDADTNPAPPIPAHDCLIG